MILRGERDFLISGFVCATGACGAGDLKNLRDEVHRDDLQKLIQKGHV